MSDMFDMLVGKMKDGLGDVCKWIECVIEWFGLEKNCVLCYLWYEWKGFWCDVVKYLYWILKIVLKEVGKELLGVVVELF